MKSRKRRDLHQIRAHRPHSAAPSTTLRTALLGSMLLGPIGCAPQVTTDYQGDPMFSMVGRVELPLGGADGVLVPSIAFMAPGEEQIRFVDAEVRGEFPAQFQLDLYAPPPAEVIGGFPFEDLDDEVRHTVGFISAVAEDHLATLYYATTLTGGEEECDAGGCTQQMQATNSDASHKGTIAMYCPTEGQVAPDPSNPSPMLPCEVSGRSGDPMFTAWISDPMFAGAAVNYAIAYLENDAAPGSVVAHRFGSPAGLSAGYHLLQWGTTADEAANQTCRDDALAEAVERYNTAHGTSVGTYDFRIQGCSEPGCEQVGPHTRGLRGEWFKVMAEMDCKLGPVFTPVDGPESAAVSLQVQPGLSFASVAAGRL